MLGFFKKKKKIDTQSVTNFNTILKVIEDFIELKDFDKATKAINEVFFKENESFKYFIENIPEKDKKTHINIFKKKIQKLEWLKEKNDSQKKKYFQSMKEKKQKQEISFIQKKVKEYIKSKNYSEALEFINTFIEKNTQNIHFVEVGNGLKKNVVKYLEKQKLIEEKSIKKDAFLEAQELIWEIRSNHQETQNEKNHTSWYTTLKTKFSFYKNFKNKLQERKLLDEVQFLLDSKSEQDALVAKAKLAQVHVGLSKEIQDKKIHGYDLYGKIMGAEKISWDSLWFSQQKKNSIFYIWDATGHGIKAWFIISQLNKKFGELSGNALSLESIAQEINNSLKQELKSGNFITSIFFQVNSDLPNQIEFVGMGHEPMFLYKKSTWETKKIIPGWLAAGIRIIQNKDQIKKKKLALDDGDILLTYTDGIIEAKNESGEMYGFDRIARKFWELSRNSKYSLRDIYNGMIQDLKIFTGKSNYLDDVTLMLLKRDSNKEILDEIWVESMILKEWVHKKYKKKILWKTKEEIQEDMQKIQKQTALSNIISSLDILYKTGELPKLKQDCIRYIKEWYIHKKINFYLKKALESESIFKIKQKNKKIQDKYHVLEELYKKWDYETVIIETSSIISKNGNI